MDMSLATMHCFFLFMLALLLTTNNSTKALTSFNSDQRASAASSCSVIHCFGGMCPQQSGAAAVY
jgi:hypothetical protein